MLRACRSICVVETNKPGGSFRFVEVGASSRFTRGVVCCVLAACLDRNPFELPDMDSGLVPLRYGPCFQGARNLQG